MYRVYDSGFRGKCATEIAEQITFVNRIRSKYPESFGGLLVHIKNEGKRTVQQASRDKAEGMVTGASDLIIPASISFVCELKRRDKTKSKVSDEQKLYLKRAREAGAFACLCYGCDEAEKAFNDWLKEINRYSTP